VLQEFSEGTECGSNIQMVDMSPLAHQLLADACHGSDAPLPIPLPHTRQIALMQMRSEWHAEVTAKVPSVPPQVW
jgi:hypothetical protein